MEKEGKKEGEVEIIMCFWWMSERREGYRMKVDLDEDIYLFNFY